jgi:hypothetical protein
MKTAALCAIAVVLSCTFALGQQYKVLWTFDSVANDGLEPVASLISDTRRNLYGTTQFGGTDAGGTVFELSPQSDGTWKEAILYNFCSIIGFSCFDGAAPQAALAFDAHGNLYGTTAEGGTNPCPTGGGGCGTVFELSPPSSGSGEWTETVLYSFCAVPRQGTNSCLDGFHPLSQLIFDASGNLYGTTEEGGNPQPGYLDDNTGVVFELSPGPNGWTETVLYNFCSIGTGNYDCEDGASPSAGVTFDPSGNLYGTTNYSGNTRFGGGLVYQLSPGPTGWEQTILINGKNSYYQGFEGSVVFDPLGNLYTTFYDAGRKGGGGALRLNPTTHKLVSFSFDDTVDSFPYSAPLLDLARKNLYATAKGPYAPGFVFQLTQSGQETTLYNFCSQPNCTDGAFPYAGLIEDKSGNLYGTTKYGGNSTTCNGSGCGVVYEITP